MFCSVVVPEVVSWENNGMDACGVDYGRLTALLIQATKKQQAVIHRQQRQIELQQAQIASLKTQVQAIRAAMMAVLGPGPEVLTLKARGPDERAR